MVGSEKNCGMHSSGVHCCMRSMDDGYSSGFHCGRTKRHRTDLAVRLALYT